jgi:transaldolase/glucose-6-phosphate isomerase
MNPLVELLQHGQSYWLDNLSRELIRGGELRRRVEEEGLRGVTSNPAIFHKAISKGDAYDEEIASLVADGASVGQIYERLVVTDIREACDILRPVFDSSDGLDGYVSLEVSPRLVHDTDGSIAEGRRLWAAVDRPNLMIKIPGTAAGVPAIEELLYEGINVNVTLLFDVPAYDEVARAHLRALHRRSDEGRPLAGVASVASFFLSRIDVLVDSLVGHRIDARLDAGGPARLLGTAAIASAKLAYRSFEEHYAGAAWDELSAAGASVQRLLWASTSTKNPLYDPVRYVEPLIGPDTVNTMPEVTIEAFAAYGTVEADTIRHDVEGATAVFEALDALGIDMVSVAAQLVNEGAEKFIGPFDALLAGLARRRLEITGEAARMRLSEAAEAALSSSLADALLEMRFARRLLAGDASLWADDGETRDLVLQRLGWLHAADMPATRIDELDRIASEAAGDGMTHVVVLGMGGSSLAAAVVAEGLPAVPGRPELLVLDDIDPVSVRAVEAEIDPTRTLFLVASKSGSTVETLSLFRHFHAAVQAAGVENPGTRFIALSDPGTPLVRLAHDLNFRGVVETPADVGGRFSALTPFGLLPAALAGHDVRGMLASARRMLLASSARAPLSENPALGLGVRLGALARDGRDKLTITTTPRLRTFAAWLEQLVAESTGKEGGGIVPVIEEPRRPTADYAADRVFLDVSLTGDESPAGAAESESGSARLDALAEAGHPVIRIELPDIGELGGEFLRWELAVAAAGALLDVNPFDEPDVNEAKRRARELLEGGDEPGGSTDAPQAAEGGLELYMDPASNGHGDVGERLRAWIDTVDPEAYVAVLAYFADSTERDRLAARLRAAIGARTGAATTLGYGPRYLHSTGQLHKGGRPGGAYLVLTGDATEDVPVPGSDYGLAELQRAQALGDATALRERGRSVARVNLGWYVDEGLGRLARIFEGEDAGVT